MCPVPTGEWIARFYYIDIDRWFVQIWITDVSFTVQPVHLISSCLIKFIIKDHDSHFEKGQNCIMQIDLWRSLFNSMHGANLNVPLYVSSNHLLIWQIQNTQVKNGLMMIAKMSSKIAKRPSDSSENIRHRTTSVISASSERMLEEQ